MVADTVTRAYTETHAHTQAVFVSPTMDLLTGCFVQNLLYSCTKCTDNT